mmetsp:Transcript_66452/g.185731  ORF Transcript_66452/g.185731 Transcript_66452/m.185731 type:complete len:271 (-) Transcript_66452:114-926(-)
MRLLPPKAPIEVRLHTLPHLEEGLATVIAAVGVLEEFVSLCASGSQGINPIGKSSNAQPPTEGVREVVAITGEDVVTRALPLRPHLLDDSEHLGRGSLCEAHGEGFPVAVVTVILRRVPRHASGIGKVALLGWRDAEEILAAIDFDAGVESAVALQHRIPQAPSEKGVAEVVDVHEHPFASWRWLPLQPLRGHGWAAAADRAAAPRGAATALARQVLRRAGRGQRCGSLEDPAGEGAGALRGGGVSAREKVKPSGTGVDALHGDGLTSNA